MNYYFPIVSVDGMWNMILSISDHCPFTYFLNIERLPLFWCRQFIPISKYCKCFRNTPICLDVIYVFHFPFNQKTACKCIILTSMAGSAAEVASRYIQSGLQDQKSVIFSHSVISLNQFLKHSKNTAYIFLTSRNHVKIFLSQNITHIFKERYIVKI